MMRSPRTAVATSIGVLVAVGALSYATVDGSAPGVAVTRPAAVPGPPGAVRQAGSEMPASAGPGLPRQVMPRPAADTPSDSFATLAVLARHEAAKAEALIRRRLPCLGCHRLGDDGGRIGPDLTSVAERRSFDFILRVIRDPQGTVPGTVMPRVPMPPETEVLVAGYLAGIRAMPAGGPDGAGRAGAGERTAASTAGTRGSADPATVGSRGTERPGERTRAAEGATGTSAQADADGAALYARYCAACHATDGGGDGPNARYLPVAPAAHADSAYMSARPDDALFDAIYAGGRIMGRSHRMPAWGLTLSREEIRALVRHMRALCGCEGPAWSRDGAGGPR